METTWLSKKWGTGRLKVENTFNVILFILKMNEIIFSAICDCFQLSFKNVMFGEKKKKKKLIAQYHLHKLYTNTHETLYFAKIN